MARKPRARKFPAMPPPTEEEQALDQQIIDNLNRATALLHQRNLDNAVLLAQQAARGQGQLGDWFCEIGRRFAHTLETPEPEPKPKLRAITGGRA